MTSIADVPIADIKDFLMKNRIKIDTNEKDIYDSAFNLILKGKGIGYSNNLIDWIIARNLLGEGKNVDYYTRGEIDLMSKKELEDLAKYLEINESNNIKQSVLNVLNYLHKLNK